jgi:hypothetical protein
LYPNGHAWAAFARLNGPSHDFLDGVFYQHFGSSEAWSDSVKSAHKALWCGEYDHEIAKLGAMLPSTLDGQPTQMKSQLSTLFPPIAQLVHAQQSEAQSLQSSAQRAAEERKKQEETNAQQEAAQSKPEVHDVLGVREDGDVTADLPGRCFRSQEKCVTLSTHKRRRDVKRACNRTSRTQQLLCCGIGSKLSIPWQVRSCSWSPPVGKG